MGSETSHIRYRVGNAPEAPAVIAFIGSETLPNLWGRKRFLLPVSYFPTIWGRKRFVPFVTYFPTNRVGNASFYRLHTFPRIFYILSDEFNNKCEFSIPFYSRVTATLKSGLNLVHPFTLFKYTLLLYDKLNARVWL